MRKLLLAAVLTAVSVGTNAAKISYRIDSFGNVTGSAGTNTRVYSHDDNNFNFWELDSLNNTVGFYGSGGTSHTLNTSLFTVADITDVTWTSNFGGNIILVTVQTVLVPAAVWLFGSALAGLGWMRRLSNKS
jgi:hypothetical protein